MVLMIPAVIGLSATQINIFINTNFAARCAQGSVSWLNYAFRLMQFPIGIFGVAISIATLPVIARQASQGDMGALKSTYVSSLTMAFLMTIPASFGLAFLAEPIIRLIFEHGQFNAQDTLHTAEALIYYAVGLFAYSSVKITVPVFYALKDTKYPVMASFLSVIANLIFVSLTLDIFQHKAIAFSNSITMIFNFVFLSAVLFRKVGGYDLRVLFRSLFQDHPGFSGYGRVGLLPLPLVVPAPESGRDSESNHHPGPGDCRCGRDLFLVDSISGNREMDEVLESLKKRFLKNTG